MPQPRAAVILAAGQGVRMRSATPKVLHEVGGRTMLAWALALAETAGAQRRIVVVAPGADAVRAAAEGLGAETVVQDEPLGTAHAVNAARGALKDFTGDVAVICADTPLIRAETLERAFEAGAGGTGGVGVLGFEPEDPAAYGRLVLGADGGLERIVEAKDASADELKIRLCNAGVVAAPGPLLFELLAQVGNDNVKGEYYLTDVVGLARKAGKPARVAVAAADEVLGVNAKAELARAEAAFQSRARAAALDAGVTLIAPETVFFSHDTALGADVTVEPHVVFGRGVTVEAGARVRAFSHLEGAIVRAGAEVGPYARLRPGAEVGANAKVGNFVEIKNASLGEGAKASHLSYIGDAVIGAKANIGAGTITCNYDGVAKHKTVIGAGAFIGSDTALVAPVSVGAGAYTGSGSVITSDVPDDALAVARGRQKNIPGWAAKFRAKQGKKDA